MYHCRQLGHMRRDCPRRQKSQGTTVEHTEQPDMQDLGLEVKAFREAMCGCSSLGCRVRVDLIGRDYELEISEILLMVDPLGGGGGGGGGGIASSRVWVHGDIASSRVWVHDDIASSRVWVHGMVIHHSW